MPPANDGPRGMGVGRARRRLHRPLGGLGGQRRLALIAQRRRPRIQDLDTAGLAGDLRRQVRVRRL